MHFQLEIGKEKHKVRFNVIITHDGINVLVTGGEKSHIGGVVLSLPRKSLAGSGMSCDSWVVPVPGHKDTVAAEKVGAFICRETEEVVSVAAGIHIDCATPEDLSIILENCALGAKMTADKILNIRKMKPET